MKEQIVTKSYLYPPTQAEEYEGEFLTRIKNEKAIDIYSRNLFKWACIHYQEDKRDDNPLTDESSRAILHLAPYGRNAGFMHEREILDGSVVEQRSAELDIIDFFTLVQSLHYDRRNSSLEEFRSNVDRMTEGQKAFVQAEIFTMRELFQKKALDLGAVTKQHILNHQPLAAACITPAELKKGTFLPWAADAK